MKRIIFVITLSMIFVLSGCTKQKDGIVKTYEETDPELFGEYLDENKMFVMEEYYEKSDGTFVTKSGYTYKYRLEISGRLHNAARDSRYVVLSNSPDITFDMAWKASGLSSNLNDYFKPEFAVIVEMG